MMNIQSINHALVKAINHLTEQEIENNQEMTSLSIIESNISRLIKQGEPKKGVRYGKRWHVEKVTTKRVTLTDARDDDDVSKMSAKKFILNWDGIGYAKGIYYLHTDGIKEIEGELPSVFKEYPIGTIVKTGTKTYTITSQPYPGPRNEWVNYFVVPKGGKKKKKMSIWQRDIPNIQIGAGFPIRGHFFPPKKG